MPHNMRRNGHRRCRMTSGGKEEGSRKEERGKDGNRHNGRRRCRIQSGGMNIQTCRHTMTEKWTKRKTKRKTERKMRSQNSRTQNNGKGRNNEIRDIERRRRANGGGAHRTTRAETGGRKREKGRGKRGIAGIPARTGHTGNGKQKIPHSTKKRKPFSLPLFCL